MQDQHCLQAIKAAVAQKPLIAMTTWNLCLYPEIQMEILKRRQEEVQHPSEYVLPLLVYLHFIGNDMHLHK